MKPAGQMTLTFTPELERFVREEVRRGAFASSSEYVRDLVRDRFLKERERAEKLAALDAALARGVADAEAGRTLPLDEALRRLRTELNLPEKKSARGPADASKVKVVVTDAALADLLQIGHAIGADNPARARHSLPISMTAACASPTRPAPFRSCRVGKTAASAVALSATI